MHAGPATEPWYHLSCREPVPRHPTLAGRHTTLVCVVGGGLAGLGTILSLAERGIPAILLEAGRLGSGASGRNGGMVSAGFTRSSLDLERRFGSAHARALHAASSAAMALIRERIARGKIACDLVEGVLVASFFDDPQGLRSEAAALNGRFGMRLELRDRAWMRETYRTERYTEGLFDPDGFHLDPLALARGYARAAAGQGALLFENSPALVLERRGAGWRVRSAEGEVEAEHVVLCTSAYGDPLAPILRRAILPVASYVIVTEPLGDQLEDAIRAPFAVYDDRFATGYYRPLPDGRLLWGGRISLRESPKDLPFLMRRDLAQIYPQLAGVRLAAVWSGKMGFARHKMPLLRSLGPGLWVNTAYGGHGLNGTTMGGELIARAISGEERALEPFRPFMPTPAFGVLGRLVAQGLYWGHAARDRLRAGAFRQRRTQQLAGPSGGR